MYALRGYLVIAVLMLIVKAIEVGIGHWTRRRKVSVIGSRVSQTSARRLRTRAGRIVRP